VENNIAVYPDERNVFYREHDDRAYRLEPFFLAYLTLELPFEFLMGIICTLFLVIPGFPSLSPSLLCGLTMRYGGVVLPCSLPSLLLRRLWRISWDYVLHALQSQWVERQFHLTCQLAVYCHGRVCTIHIASDR
jgi:hypothetical protein